VSPPFFKNEKKRWTLQGVVWLNLSFHPSI
jgi:hypothetical protein